MKMYFVWDTVKEKIVSREAVTGSGYTKIGYAKGKATLRNNDRFYNPPQDGKPNRFIVMESDIILRPLAEKD